MSSKISTTHYNIHRDEIQKTTFAFIADFHNSEVEPAMEILDECKVDAVLIGGDFVHNHDNYINGIDLLKQCSEKYPTFVEIGNHETKSNLDVISLVNESGATLLDNTYTEYRGMVIGGLTTGFGFDVKQSPFKKTPKPKLDWLEEFCGQKGYKILINHHPEYYPKYLIDKDIDLILSGHAHGGQWRLFGQGLIAPGQGLFPKYTSGFYDNKMIVSRGATKKNLIPRINNKPEVIIITIGREV